MASQAAKIIGQDFRAGRVILCGSTAMGTDGFSSDVDFCVETPRPLLWEEEEGFMVSMTRRLGREGISVGNGRGCIHFSVISRRDLENPEESFFMNYGQHVNEHGITLWPKE